MFVASWVLSPRQGLRVVGCVRDSGEDVDENIYKSMCLFSTTQNVKAMHVFS